MNTAASPDDAMKRAVRAEHDWMEAKLEELEAACRANDRTQMVATFNELEVRVLAHFEAEERLVVPLLLAASPEVARAVVVEHLRRRMIDLGQAIDLHTVRQEMIGRFVDELRAHGRSEDRIAIPCSTEDLRATPRAAPL